MSKKTTYTVSHIINLIEKLPVTKGMVLKAGVLELFGVKPGGVVAKTWADDAWEALQEGIEMFGSYTYGDKGADEIMDVDEHVRSFKKLSEADAYIELKKLLSMADSAGLVGSILGSIDDGDESSYQAIFNDAELMEHY